MKIKKIINWLISSQYQITISKKVTGQIEYLNSKMETPSQSKTQIHNKTSNSMLHWTKQISSY